MGNTLRIRARQRDHDDRADERASSDAELSSVRAEHAARAASESRRLGVVAARLATPTTADVTSLITFNPYLLAVAVYMLTAVAITVRNYNSDDFELLAQQAAGCLAAAASTPVTTLLDILGALSLSAETATNVLLVLVNTLLVWAGLGPQWSTPVVALLCAARWAPSDFVSTISHDVRGALVLIRAFAQLVARGLCVLLKYLLLIATVAAAYAHLGDMVFKLLANAALMAEPFSTEILYSSCILMCLLVSRTRPEPALAKRRAPASRRAGRGRRTRAKRAARSRNAARHHGERRRRQPRANRQETNVHQEELACASEPERATESKNPPLGENRFAILAVPTPARISFAARPAARPPSNIVKRRAATTDASVTRPPPFPATAKKTSTTRVATVALSVVFFVSVIAFAFRACGCDHHSRELEQSCPGLYGGCHPPQQVLSARQVAERCSATTDGIGRWLDEHWLNEAQGNDDHRLSDKELNITFCKFGEGEELVVEPAKEGVFDFDPFCERVGRYIGIGSRDVDDIVITVVLSTCTWRWRQRDRSTALWRWAATSHTVHQDDEPVAFSAEHPVFKRDGAWWYIADAQFPDTLDSDDETSGSDAPEAAPAAAQDADVVPLDEAPPGEPPQADEPPAQLDTRKVLQNADAASTVVSKWIETIAKMPKMESVKVNVTFCKIVGNLQSGNNVDDDAPFCEYSRRCHDHKPGQRVSSDPSNDQTATLTAWIRRDGRRTRWNAIVGGNPRVTDGCVTIKIHDFHPVFSTYDGEMWVLKSAEAPDLLKLARETASIANKASKKKAKEKHRTPAERLADNAAAVAAAASGGSNEQPQPATRDRIATTVDNSSRAKGTGPCDNYDDVAIPTETELESSCHPALRRLVCDAVGGYNAELDEDEKAAIFGRFLSIPKRFLRRIPGSAPRSLRHQQLMKQLVGADVFDFERCSDSPAKGKAAPSEEQQDKSAVMQAKSIASRGYTGKATRALERIFAPHVPKPEMVTKLGKLHPPYVCKTGGEDMSPQTDKSGTDPHHPPVNTDGLGRSAPASMKVTVDELRESISNCCKGAAPGPTGWTEELLLPLFADHFVAAKLALMANDVMNYNVSESIRERLTACRLVGIGKPCGGVRPIAVSDVLLKAVCAIAMKRLGTELPEHFDGMQYGIMFKGGAETVAHALRELINSDPDMQLVALDATNAFNTPSRTSIADASTTRRGRRLG